MFNWQLFGIRILSTTKCWKSFCADLTYWNTYTTNLLLHISGIREGGGQPCIWFPIKDNVLWFHGLVCFSIIRQTEYSIHICFWQCRDVFHSPLCLDGRVNVPNGQSCLVWFGFTSFRCCTVMVLETDWVPKLDDPCVCVVLIQPFGIPSPHGR